MVFGRLAAVDALERVGLAVHDLLSDEAVLLHDAEGFHVLAFAGVFVVDHDLIHGHVVYFAHFTNFLVTVEAFVGIVSVAQAFLAVVVHLRQRRILLRQLEVFLRAILVFSIHDF